MTVGRCLLLLGFVCLVIVVFTHVAERLHLFPGMGWGFGHLSMMGGMLFVMAFGAGAYSVDALMTRPSTGLVAARRLRDFSS
jgi:uncharacterized membrane protein YphA (DoxX/SURF4 family)